MLCKMALHGSIVKKAVVAEDLESLIEKGKHASMVCLPDKNGVGSLDKYICSHLSFHFSQWLFVRHPYGDLYLLFVRESVHLIGLFCDC